MPLTDEQRAELEALGPAVISLVSFHLNALFLTCFHVVKVRVDARLVLIKRVLVFSAWIDLWRADLCRAAAARKRKRERAGR
jgi:hypothetical protein